MLRNQTEIPTVQTVMSDPYYFSKISLFRFFLMPLTIDNQLWRSAYKMLWLSLSYAFSTFFSTKVNKHCLVYWEYLNNTYDGALHCKRTIKTNHKNYLDFKILWSLHISFGRKPEPSPYSQKTLLTIRKRKKHEEAEGVMTDLTQLHQFISTTNSW